MVKAARRVRAQDGMIDLQIALAGGTAAHVKDATKTVRAVETLLHDLAEPPEPKTARVASREWAKAFKKVSA